MKKNNETKLNENPEKTKYNPVHTLFRIVFAVFFIWFALNIIKDSFLSALIFTFAGYVCSPFFRKSYFYKHYQGSKTVMTLVVSLIAGIIGMVVMVSANRNRNMINNTPSAPPPTPIIQQTTEPAETNTQEVTTIPTTTEIEITETTATEPPTLAPTEPPTEAPTPAPQIGKSIEDLKLYYFGSVPNDSTGNWKYSMFSGAEIDFCEYVPSYYAEYMSGDEIHAVINAASRKTYRLTPSSFDPDSIYITVFQYVDGEEHDANLMFSGNAIAYYTVNIETGEITED